MKFPDAMHRYLSEIRRNLDAATQVCPFMAKCEPCPEKCAFDRGSDPCDLRLAIEVFGHAEGHDPAAPARKIGLCPYGVERGEQVECQSVGPCEFQRMHNYPLQPYQNWIRCGREAAALAAADQHQLDEEITPEMKEGIQKIFEKHTLPPALPEGGTDVMK